MTTPEQLFSIHPATLMGHVSLTVANLDNQIAFYQRTLGFVQHWREGNSAGLGSGGADLLRLTEQPNLKRYRGVTGLYHFAVLFPNRRELARAVTRLFSLRYFVIRRIIMTKTTYLDDLKATASSCMPSRRKMAHLLLRAINLSRAARWHDERWA